MVAAAGLCTVVLMCWLAASAAATVIKVNTHQGTTAFDAARLGSFSVTVRHTARHAVRTGVLAGYRITVTNRSGHTARNLWICSRIPRHMAFVRATRRLRAFHGMRCLVLATFLPSHSTSFHLTVIARVRHRPPLVRFTG